MSDFKLGDRVVMTGTAKKDRDYLAPGSADFTTKYVEEKLPHVYNAEGGTTYVEGVVVGRRFMQEGVTKYNSGYNGDNQFQCSGVTHRVWIISFDLRYKPVMCFDDQLSLAHEERSAADYAVATAEAFGIDPEVISSHLSDINMKEKL